MILVDDVSRDDTVEIARRLGLEVIVHRQNLGYGGNQKTCYDRALEFGADVVVMLHPDYQYDATRIPALVAPILAGDADLVLGSRFLGDPIAGGMPKWKYVSNRFLTGVENLAFGLHLSEYHTGLRAYSRRLLEAIPYELNSNDFVFDQELIAQVVAAGGLGIDEIAVPTRYFEEASSVGFKRSVVYGLSTLRVVARYLLHRTGIRRSRQAGAANAVARARRRLTCATSGAASGARRSGSPSRPSRSSSSSARSTSGRRGRRSRPPSRSGSRSCSASSSWTCSCAPSAGGSC